MGRLILVEGIPGSGKTTISKRIAEYLSEKGAVKHYAEGDGHPADLAWCACIPAAELKDLLKEFPQYETPVREHMYEEDGYAIIPYTQFPIQDEKFLTLMERHEVYDNRVDYNTFTSMHRKKWMRFGKQANQADETFVFECAFLQNHINELLLFHCLTQKQIKDYFISLIKTVTDLNPILIYLTQPSVFETLKRVSDIRITENGEKIWMERVIQYIETSPYGMKHSLTGFKGMVSYFEERKNIELDVIKNLPIRTVMIKNPDYNWMKVWNDVKEVLK